MDGFYAAYFTGLTGNSIGLFIFENGLITGVDVGGMHYDGTYSLDESASIISGKIAYVIPPGASLVTGISSSSKAIRAEFPLELPAAFADGRVVQLDTPSGVVNAKFEKLRGR
ncbi:MAG: hypothetical protein V7704_01515 [Aurantimonas endophytica]|uniref:hypothetical protein n=1 Tax=Aurantimonas endophytica TaxID=1522175 RepID=UPI00300155D7